LSRFIFLYKPSLSSDSGAGGVDIRRDEGYPRLLFGAPAPEAVRDWGCRLCSTRSCENTSISKGEFGVRVGLWFG
jgi:hypothetical protein